MNRSLTFVIGPPRSGTTLMLQALGLHPQILAIGEELHRFHHDLGKLGHRHDEDDHFRYTARDATAEVAYEYGEALAAAVRSSGRKHVVVKISTLSLQVDYLAALFPDARFVQCVRDGRDSVCSMEDLRRALQREQDHPRLLGPAPDPFSLWAAETFENPYVRAGCAWFYHVTRSYLDLRFAGADKFLRLRYEDLLADARERMHDVLRFIGVPWDGAMDAAVKATTDVPGPTDTIGFSTSHASGARRARYQRDLPNDVRVVLAPLLARPMELMGYNADAVSDGVALACKAIGVDAAVWLSRVTLENDWFERQLATFNPMKMLRESDMPALGAKPLLIDGATFGSHADVRDGSASVAHSWVRKQNREYAFADAGTIWPTVAARLDGNTPLEALLPPEHLEAARRICAKLHGLGLVGYV